MKTLDTLGSEFTKRHEWLLDAAKSCEVAICGGCAAAIVKEKTDYQPADIDMVTTKANALRFIDQINHFLINKIVHFRLYVNSHNGFVPKPAVAHYRIQVPFWLPVCLFILPHDQFRFYRIQKGHLLQLPQDVKGAAVVLVNKDGKPRIAADMEIDEPVPHHAEIEEDDFYFIPMSMRIADKPEAESIAIMNQYP